MTKEIRITQVLDYFKEDWYIDWVLRFGKAHCNRVSKEAMAIGTFVDEAIKSGKVVAPKKHSHEIGNCLSAYKKWRETYQPKSISPCSRMRFEDERFIITGEPDLDIDKCITDIKCSSKISLKYKIQVNMYEFLRRKNGMEPYDDVAILRLDKSLGSFEYWRDKYDPKLVSVWCGLAEAYVLFKGDSDE